MTWTVQQHKTWLQKAWQMLIFNFGGLCYNCGSREDLQFSHVLPTKLSGQGRGKDARYYDILKHPVSYKLRCVKCHLEYDSKRKAE